MSLVFDIILLLIIVFTIIGGYKNGFVKSIMGLVSLVASAFLAYQFTPSLAAHLGEKFVKAPIVKAISDSIVSVVGNVEEATDWSSLFGSGSSGVFKALTERYGADYEALSQSYASSEVSEGVISDIANTIATPVSNMISSIIAFLIIFVGMLIIFSIVTLVLNSVVKLPLLSTVNKFLGLGLGIVTAFIYAWLFAKVIVAVIGAFGSVNPELFSQATIDNSQVLRWLSERKFFYDLFKF